MDLFAFPMTASEFFIMFGYALIFGGPVIVCNSFANFSRIFPYLANPVDFGKKMKDGRRIFGDHKTWRGIFFGIVFGTLSGVLFWYYCVVKHDKFSLASNLDFEMLKSGFPVYPWYTGFFMSLGDHFGDLLGSFIKRRLNIKSGGALPLYDQGFWMVTGLVFALPFIWAEVNLWFYFVTMIIATPVLHFLSNPIAYLIGLKDVW